MSFYHNFILSGFLWFAGVTRTVEFCRFLWKYFPSRLTPFIVSIFILSACKISTTSTSLVSCKLQCVNKSYIMYRVFFLFCFFTVALLCSTLFTIMCCIIHTVFWDKAFCLSAINIIVTWIFTKIRVIQHYHQDEKINFTKWIMQHKKLHRHSISNNAHCMFLYMWTAKDV